MVNWSGFAGSAGVVAGVIVLAGSAQGLLGGHGPSVADEVAAVPAVSAPPAAAPDAYLCSVSCAAPESPLLSAGEHRARAAYWASQKVTLPRSSGSGGSVSVAAPKQAKAPAQPKAQPKQATASQPRAAKPSSPKQQAAPKAPKQPVPSTTVTVTQRTSTTSKGTTTTSTTTKTTSKG